MSISLPGSLWPTALRWQHVRPAPVVARRGCYAVRLVGPERVGVQPHPVLQLARVGPPELVDLPPLCQALSRQRW